MPSPFPGVDPFIESQKYWPDFHNRFITHCCDLIAERLPDDYEARVDERIALVEVIADEVKGLGPDVAITRHDSTDLPRGQAAAGVLELEPVAIPLRYLQNVREAFIRILHRPDRELVAVLELLSPTNKAGGGRRDYLTKRDALLREEAVHVIELDFLVAGRRLPMERPLPPGDYYAFVARTQDRPDCSVYAWSVRHPLPAIRIPLAGADPDLRLDLGEVFRTVYERGRYARSIDYQAPLDLPLRPEDRAWAEGLARAHVR